MGLCEKWVVSALTDLETEVFGGFGVGVAAEVFVDDVLVFAGTGLLKTLEYNLVREPLYLRLLPWSSPVWHMGI